MGSGWEQRRGRGEKFQEEVKGMLKSQGKLIVPMGAEKVAPRVQEMLRKIENPDNTARFFRYTPDGFAVDVESGEAFFYDCKDGRAIEKEAFENYVAYAGEDRSVFVFIKHGEKTYQVPLRGLSLLDSWEEVGRYCEEKRMPIDEDGWIAPRLWPKWKYDEWKANHQGASGTPFRYFDFKKMEQFVLNGRNVEILF